MSPRVARIVFCFACTAWVAASAEADDKQVNDLAKKLYDAAKQYSEPYQIEQKPAEHLPLLRSLAAVRKQIDEAKKAHADGLTTPKTPGLERLKFALADADRWLPEYEKAARAYASGEAIRKDLDEVVKLAKQGVENKSPAYFNADGDVVRVTRRAKDRLAAMEALDTDPNSKAATPYSAALQATARQVRELQAGLRDQILAQNAPPPDLYQKADRDAVLKVVADTWAKAGGKAEVLKVGVVTADWTRKESWELVGKELQKVDRSRIQGYVLVKLDDTTAVRYSVNLVKDHLAGDAVSASLLDDPKAEPELGSLLPRSKLK
jgi:hypothetical protein